MDFSQRHREARKIAPKGGDFRRGVLVALSVLWLGGASVAHAQGIPETRSSSPGVERSPAFPADGVNTPRFEAKQVTDKAAVEAVRNDPKIAPYLRERPGATWTTSRESDRRWKVSFWWRNSEVAVGYVHPNTGQVTEAWTGPQVAWVMARGIDGAFGKKITAGYVWIPLLLIFMLPFIDFRRPVNMLTLDILMLASLSVSLAFLNSGDLSKFVPLTTLPLLYLLFRMLWLGLRADRSPRRGLRLPLRARWLGMGAILLVGFKIGINLLDSNVVDVGYASVVGADRIAHFQEIYGNFPNDVGAGDTYGPVTYLAYLPFELIFSWRQRFDDLAAAHAAALFFDVATLVGMYFAGRRFAAGARGRRLGMVFAFAWAAFPYTFYVSNSNSNDSIVPMVLVWAFVALRSSVGRGILLALASATKFAPVILAPLWFSYPRLFSRPRQKILFGLAFSLVLIAVVAPFVVGPGIVKVYDRTIGYQMGRSAPFSIWGLHPVSLAFWHAVAKGIVVVGAVVVAFLPRRKTPLNVMALSAALLIAVELTATYWFYLYIVWFFPFTVMAIVAARIRHAGVSDDGEIVGAGAEWDGARPPERTNERRRRRLRPRLG